MILIVTFVPMVIRLCRKASPAKNHTVEHLQVSVRYKFRKFNYIDNGTGDRLFYHNHKIIAMSDIFYMTQESYDKLSDELMNLKTVERAKASAAIAEAREKGDLSENAEYDAAKDAQGMLEAKINELEKSVANARIIDESQLDTSKVTVLCKVTIKNTQNGKEITYKLVAPSEADLKEKKISVKSPIGEGLLGKAVGDSVEITTPAGKMNFEIVNIGI